MNVGDLVTGIDRSYKRSIYKVLKINSDEFDKMRTMDLQFICLDGQLGTSKDISRGRIVAEFRLASKQEVDRELGMALGYQLIGFVVRLIGSYREQQ